jgi:DNA replication protein DnaC
MYSERDKKYLRKIRSDCPQCHGHSIDCSCIDIQRFETKKVKANVPPKYRAFTFEQITHPQTADVRIKIKGYLDNLNEQLENGMGLFLSGSTGLGKTAIASIALMDAIKLGKTGHFLTLDQCLNLYIGGWKDEDLKRQYQEFVLGVDVLVIDEVGNEPRTNINMVGSCLNDILRRRSNNLQTTIITSNLFFKKIKDVYGEETYSILSECVIPFELNGIDFREGRASV